MSSHPFIYGIDFCFNAAEPGTQAPDGHYDLGCGFIQRGAENETWQKVAGFSEDMAQNNRFGFTFFDMSRTVTSIDFVTISMCPGGDSPRPAGKTSPFSDSDEETLRNLLDDRDSGGTAPLNAPCFAAAASLARLGQDGPKIAKLLAEVLKERENLGGLEPAALRHAWRHGMPTKDVVDRIVERLAKGRAYSLHSEPQLVALLGEIGPDARAAIPTLRRFQKLRHEFRTAATDALRRIAK